MKCVEELVDDAIRELGIDATECTKLSSNDADHVLKSTECAFVDDDIDGRVWWHRLKNVQEAFEEPRGVQLGSVSSLLPDICGDYVFFIPDRDEGDGRNNPVYIIRPSCLDEVLHNTWQFEYYIVSTLFTWMLAVTDHCQVIRCRKPIEPGSA